MSQKSVFLAQSAILQKYLCHYGSTRKLLIQLDEKQFLCPSTGEKRKSTANGREYAAYRERYYNAAEGMSHTVTSRELVYQVPLQKAAPVPLLFFRDCRP